MTCPTKSNSPKKKSPKRTRQLRGNTAVANPAQVWGNPEVEDDLKTFFNMGVDLDASKDDILWVSVYTEDGFQAWSSPIYVIG